MTVVAVGERRQSLLLQGIRGSRRRQLCCSCSRKRTTCPFGESQSFQHEITACLSVLRNRFASAFPEIKVCFNEINAPLESCKDGLSEQLQVKRPGRLLQLGVERPQLFDVREFMKNMIFQRVPGPPPPL